MEMVLKFTEDVKILCKGKDCHKFHLSQLSMMPLEFSLPAPQGSVTMPKGIPECSFISTLCSHTQPVLQWHCISWYTKQSLPCFPANMPLRPSTRLPKVFLPWMSALIVSRLLPAKSSLTTVHPLWIVTSLLEQNSHPFFPQYLKRK